MGRVEDALVGGWQLSSIFLYQTGPFLSAYFPSGQGDPSGTGSGLNAAAGGDGSHRAQKPDRVGSAKPHDQGRNNWINVNSFVCPGDPLWAPGNHCITGAAAGTTETINGITHSAPLPIGRFGNSQIGDIVGPGTVNLSSGLSKTFAISERAKFRIEGTFTNVLNHTNLGDPSLDISKGGFGKITASRGSDFGGSRTGQISGRFEF